MTRQKNYSITTTTTTTTTTWTSTSTSINFITDKKKPDNYQAY
jgi:hypothetical protein